MTDTFTMKACKNCRGEYTHLADVHMILTLRRCLIALVKTVGAGKE
jgi:hypothetical protein